MTLIPTRPRGGHVISAKRGEDLHLDETRHRAIARFGALDDGVAAAISGATTAHELIAALRIAKDVVRNREFTTFDLRIYAGLQEMMKSIDRMIQEVAIVEHLQEEGGPNA